MARDVYDEGRRPGFFLVGRVARGFRALLVFGPCNALDPGQNNCVVLTWLMARSSSAGPVRAF